ncbi:MAG: PAS domain S-box protein [Actinomycetota bacterium]
MDLDLLNLVHQFEQELLETQALAHVGSWRWDVESKAVTWSFEMYRIYGMSPQEFEPSETSILDCVHPEDRERLAVEVRDSLGRGNSFAVDHRVVRPDGSIRFVRALGEAIRNENGETIRFFGTSQDVTDFVESEAARLRSERKFNDVLQHAPDAVIGVNEGGVITLANEQADNLFGYDKGGLIGIRVDELLPESRRSVHVRHRAEYLKDLGVRPMGTGLELSARRRDGSEFSVDISLSPIHTEEGLLITAFIRDVSHRKHLERQARLIQEAETRRAQALEINDSIVQGISTAVYALEANNRADALRALEGTLDAARHMITDLLPTSNEKPQIAAGDLIRGKPASIKALQPKAHQEPEPKESNVRVLLVDDSSDIRLVLRYGLSPQGFEIVGEAENGAEAVLEAKRTQPDLILLDLAMPVMDGLQALPKIKAVSPRSKIIALSGYGRDQANDEALRLGADAYIEKGSPIEQITDLARSLLPEKDIPKEVPSNQIDEQWSGKDDIDIFMHEVRTFLTVAHGIAETLTTRIDVLPSPVVRELLQSMLRNTQQMRDLIEAVPDALNLKEPTLLIEQTDVSSLLRQTVLDLKTITLDRPVLVDAPKELIAFVDSVRLRQVLANLITNAAKFSAADAPIEIELKAQSDAFDLQITDHGRGIPSDHLEELFGKFNRLGAKSPGLGLGLYISRGIARAHHGTLELVRTGERGSTFRLHLPLLQKTSA